MHLHNVHWFVHSTLQKNTAQFTLKTFHCTLYSFRCAHCTVCCVVRVDVYPVGRWTVVPDVSILILLPTMASPLIQSPTAASPRLHPVLTLEAILHKLKLI